MLQRNYTDIIWYENIYQISNDWHVLRKDTWEILYWWQNKWWYINVTLSQNWFSKKYLMHRLVAQHFILQKNEYQNIVNHKDWDKTNNKLDNLEWCTPLENVQHAWRELWLVAPTKWMTWKDCYHSKKVKQLDKEWNLIKIWDAMMDIQRELWISYSCISSTCRWRTKTSWWYRWEFLIDNNK